MNVSTGKRRIEFYSLLLTIMFTPINDLSVELNAVLSNFDSRLTDLETKIATCKGAAEVTAPAVDSTTVAATDVAPADATATN